MYHKTPNQNNNDVMLSKKLSWLLRHGAVKEGLTIQPNGFIKVDDILKHRNYARVFTLFSLRKIVENDAKQRYTLRSNPETGCWEIRANQGHTLPQVEAEQCLQIVPTAEHIPLAVHGTYYRHWESIKAQGLRRMNRNHVHFATSDSRADNISGFRSDCQLLIYLNVKKIYEEGKMQLYRSDNNVILCSGLEDGSIPSIYFDKVVERKTGKHLEF